MGVCENALATGTQDPDTDAALCGWPLRALHFSDLLENEEYSPIRPLEDWLICNGSPL